MEFITNLLLFAPTVPDLNFVGRIVEWLYNMIGNYGWTVVVFTLFLKVIMLPVDFWQRYSGKMSSEKMASMSEVIEKIDKTYANDKQRANTEKMRLYKKNGYSALSSCLPMLASMAIFIVMFGGLNSYTSHVNVKNFNTLNDAYVAGYATVDIPEAGGEFTEEDVINAMKDAINAGQANVKTKYKEIEERWLWINNVWRPDTWSSPMATYKEFSKGGIGTTPVVGVDENIYNYIRDAVIVQQPGYFGSWNGLLILPLLAIGLSFLSTKLTTANLPKGNPTAANNKFMLFLMPIMIGYFAVSYTGAFAIYLVTNSALTILSMLAINPLVAKMVKNKIEKQNPKVSYRR